MVLRLCGQLQRHILRGQDQRQNKIGMMASFRSLAARQLAPTTIPINPPLPASLRPCITHNVPPPLSTNHAKATDAFHQQVAPELRSTLATGEGQVPYASSFELS